MISGLRIKYDPINAEVLIESEDNNEVLVSLKKVDENEKSDEIPPLYELKWSQRVELAAIPAGQYRVTDIIMPTFVETLARWIIKSFKFGDEDGLVDTFEKQETELVNISYFYSDDTECESEIPIFISSYTEDDDAANLYYDQCSFNELWYEFLEDKHGKLDEMVIGFFTSNNFLSDFCYMINIFLNFSLNLGEENE